jgi:putative ABC transport system substrate-binding protein
MNFGFAILDFGLGRQGMRKKIQTTTLRLLSGSLKSKIQSRKLMGIVAIAVTFALFGAVAQAQQPAKIPRIGYLTAAYLTAISARTEAFRQGLRELGHMEGKNIVIEWRSGEGKFDRLPALAAELVGLKVDVIVTSTTPAIQAAKQATSTIPIVTISADPVGTGLVASLARPGGNITGLSVVGPEISGKQLELLKETLPKVKRVAFIWDPANAALTLRFKEVEIAARTLRLQIQSVEVRTPNELKSNLESATNKGAGGLVVPPPMSLAYRRQIVDFAAKNRLPAIYEERESVEAGGLMSYGANITDLYRRAATYVDKILKGAKPADLPVEQPTKFEFIINLKAAKQIGLAIPPNVLARADRVIR